MGRQVRRVPVDFDWPINKTWAGFLTPESLWLPDCPDCGGCGFSETARQMQATWYANDLPYGSEAWRTTQWCDKLVQSDVDALWDSGRLKLDFPQKPTAEQVNDWQRGRRGLGHDAINRMIVIDHRCEAIGAASRCPRCEGHGDVGTPDQRAALEAWESTEPPVGDGWQLWETVSEGSPISPVFDSAERLARWMTGPYYTWGASSPMEYNTALRFVIGHGWAPSMVLSPGSGLQSGEQWVGERA